MRGRNIMNRTNFIKLVLIVILLLSSCTVAAFSAGEEDQAKIIRTLVFHEITSFPGPANDGEFNWANTITPMISDNGERVTFTKNNYTDRKTRTYIVFTDGVSPRELDSFDLNGGGQSEISPDGSKVVVDNRNNGATELRLCDDTSLKSTFALDGLNGLQDFRINNNGQIYFRLDGDTNVRGSSPPITVKRGIWRINFDGSGLTQIVSADQVASLLGVSADSIGFPGCFQFGLDLTPDNSRIVFVASSSKGSHIIGANSDGSGLREYTFPKDYIRSMYPAINSIGISGDGSKVYYIINPTNPWGTVEVGVFNFDGSGRRILINGSPDYYVPKYYGKLNYDGSMLFLGGDRELLVALQNDSRMQVASLGGWDSSEPALVGDGLWNARMDGKGDKFLYSTKDSIGRVQLAVMEVNPADLGEAPRIDNPKIEPSYLLANDSSVTNVSASIVTTNRLVGVGSDFFLNGLQDQSNSGRISLNDNGKNGDLVAGDGIYSGVIRGNPNMPIGPRIVRIKAEVKGNYGRRHATAVDLSPFIVAKTENQARDYFAPPFPGIHSNYTYAKHEPMRLTKEELNQWIKEYNNEPELPVAAAVNDRLTVKQYPESNGSSFSLLPYLNYSPSERDQGPNCGSCWEWTTTGVMEIALAYKNGIKDRLSVQYLNSHLQDTCCGGTIGKAAQFYANSKMAIPWSNSNAQWQDSDCPCHGNSSVAPSSISTSKNYPIKSITAYKLVTWGPHGKDIAIEKIKEALNHGYPCYVSIFFPNDNEFKKFCDFWGNQPENVVWNADLPDGSTYDYQNGGSSHAVLCVGYNDTDPNNRYWIILNSWGAPPNRPNGLFRINMDMDYSTHYDACNAFWFQTLDINYDVPPVRNINHNIPNVPSIIIPPKSPTNNPQPSTIITANQPPIVDSLVADRPSPQIAGTSITWTAGARDPDNDQILYKFFLNSKPVTDWITDNQWTWSTTSGDVGENQIEVKIRDGKHAGPDSYDSDKITGFTITGASPAPVSPPNNVPINSPNSDQTAANWDKKGMDFLNMSMPNDALQCFDRAIEINPNIASYWKHKGNALLKQGNYDGAIQAYDQAIQIDPKLALTWLNKGYALEAQGNYDGAIQAYDQAIQIDPKLALAWNNKGNALKAQGNYGEAIQAYDQALQIDPKFAPAWYNKGLALQALGQTAEANAAFDNAQKLGLTVSAQHNPQLQHQGQGYQNAGEFIQTGPAVYYPTPTA